MRQESQHKNIRKDIEMESKNIYQKLALARVQLQNAKLKKTGKNDYAGFNYFELGDFLPQINVIFEQLELCSMFHIEQRFNEETGIDLGKIAQLKIIDTETNETVEFQSPVAEAGQKGNIPIQALGAEHTYMRRYLWLEAMEITECDVVDATIDKDKQKQKTVIDPYGNEMTKTYTPLSDKQKAIIENSYKGEDLKKLLEKYNATSIDELSKQEASKIIQRLMDAQKEKKNGTSQGN